MEEPPDRAPRGRISVGCFHDPREGRERPGDPPLVDHLALDGPPREEDPFPGSPGRSLTILPRGLVGRLSGPFDPGILSRARETIARCRAPRVAERLVRIASTGGSFSMEGEIPPLHTEDLLDEFIAGARDLSGSLGVPLAVEPVPTWLRLDLPQLPEGEFLSRLLEASGCDLLLDIPAAILSARTAGRAPRDFIADLPLERTVEIQVAGLARDPILEEDWIGPVAPASEILDLMILAARRAPRLDAVTLGRPGMEIPAGVRQRALRDIRDRLGILMEAS